jgi:zinc and cadmium transporter
MAPIYWILLMTIINGFVALAGAVTFLFSRKFLDKLLLVFVSFATGALLGGAIFHFLPEAYGKISIPLILLLTFVGILIFYLTEKILHWHHCHDEHCKKHPFTYLILYGDAIHNFIDGLIIASSFLISTKLGIISSILIISHELPQEISNFGVLVYGGITRGKALFYSFLAQLTAILGGLIGYFFLSAKDYAAYLLPIAAGGFFYIAINDLIPEILKERNKIKMIINLIAIILGLLILISAKLLIG